MNLVIVISFTFIVIFYDHKQEDQIKLQIHSLFLILEILKIPYIDIIH